MRINLANYFTALQFSPPTLVNKRSSCYLMIRYSISINNWITCMNLSAIHIVAANKVTLILLGN